MDLHIIFLPLVPTSYPGLYNFLYLKLVVVFINLLYRSSAAMLSISFSINKESEGGDNSAVQCISSQEDWCDDNDEPHLNVVRRSAAQRNGVIDLKGIGRFGCDPRSYPGQKFISDLPSWYEERLGFSDPSMPMNEFRTPAPTRQLKPHHHSKRVCPGRR